MRGNIYLGGGGSAADEAELWHEAFRTGAKVAVWPFAQPYEGRRGSGDWMTGALRSMGQYSIDVAMTTDDAADQLGNADVIAVPGGNTFLLLHELRTSGLLLLLREHLETGGALYGGSAGAVLVGRDVAIASVADSNHVGLEDTRGLNLLHDLDVLPHYTHDQEIAARRIAAESGRSVLCIPEVGGVVSSARDPLRNVGSSSAYIVHPGHTEVLEPS